MRPEHALRDPSWWSLPSSPASGTAAPRRGFHLTMRRELDTWLGRYATLVTRAVQTGPERRASLSRELLELSGRRDRVRRLLDELATAAGDHQWEMSRQRIESAWQDVQTLTTRLARRLGA